VIVGRTFSWVSSETLASSRFWTPTTRGIFLLGHPQRKEGKEGFRGAHSLCSFVHLHHAIKRREKKEKNKCSKRSYYLLRVATMPKTNERTVMIMEGVDPLLPLTAMTEMLLL
jgi:hypothetical protein